MSHRQERSRKVNDFSLTPKERATYGVTVTARDLVSGRTRTFVQTNETAMNALRLIVAELDLLPGDWRVVTISSPVTIRRDIYANRIALTGDHEGHLENANPEVTYLAKIGRRDRLHPDYQRSGTPATYNGPSLEQRSQ